MHLAEKLLVWVLEGMFVLGLAGASLVLLTTLIEDLDLLLGSKSEH